MNEDRIRSLVEPELRRQMEKQGEPGFQGGNRKTHAVRCLERLDRDAISLETVIHELCNRLSSVSISPQPKEEVIGKESEDCPIPDYFLTLDVVASKLELCANILRDQLQRLEV